MIYLILAMVCSMLISVLMRLSEGRSNGGAGMLAANYVMCCVLGCAFAGGVNLFPDVPGLGKTLGLGAVNGCLYLGSFMLLQWNISRNGVVLPATFMKLGVLVPTVMSIFVFGETLRITQALGILAALAAIVMLNGAKGEKTGSFAGLVLLLIGGGAGDAMSKVYEEIGEGALKNQFLLYTFLTALLLCAAVCLIRRQRISWKDCAFGLMIGVPNYLSSRFLLLSLSEVPAVVAYPCYSVGTIVLAAAAGALLFHERLTRRKLAAIGVILCALVLLNV